jgi:hypothetical protein
MQVSVPFQMLNMINFLVFRVTRQVVFSLELCAGRTAAEKVRGWAECRQQQGSVS